MYCIYYEKIFTILYYFIINRIKYFYVYRFFYNRRLYFIGKQSVPIKHKRQVADVEMEIKRTKEEITVTEQDMINYITYYKHTVLVKLHDQQTSLEICLNGTCSIYCEVYYRLYRVYKKNATV